MQNLLFKNSPKPKLNSISVDGAWSWKTRDFEYQGINTKTKEILFKSPVYHNGTNNIAEYLAIVHAIAYCKQNNLKNKTIYSDSLVALSWIGKKHDNSSEQHELLTRANNFLQNNKYANPVLKWHTKIWGEIGADHNRK